MMNFAEESERFIPNQKASRLNYHIKRENMRLNEHSIRLISSLFSEQCENGTNKQTVGSSNNKEMKVLSFCGPYTSRDKRLASRCGREEKKSKKSKIDYKLSQLSILDAPGVVDNWYYSLMSWNHSTNKIAVALSEEIYLYDFNSKRINRLVPAHDILRDGPNAMKIVSSIEWMKGKDLVYGDVLGNLQVIDHVVGRRLRKLNGRGIGSIYSLASRGEHLVTAGTKDGKVLHHDLRIKNSLTSKLNVFSSVASVGWSQDGSKFACGLLDNLAYVFEDSVTSNYSNSLPLHTLKHKSAVGNVKFCPHNNNLLATAGGIYDKSVRFFEVSSGNCLNEVNTNKQVCDVAWVNDKLMISAQNDIMLLSPKSKQPLFVHSTSGSKENRILSLCASKDNQFVCTLNRDEQFNFYEFETTKEETKRSALWDLQLMR